MAFDIEVAGGLEPAPEYLACEGVDTRPVAGGADVLLPLRRGRLKAKRLVPIAELSEVASSRRIRTARSARRASASRSFPRRRRSRTPPAKPSVTTSSSCLTLERVLLALETPGKLG